MINTFGGKAHPVKYGIPAIPTTPVPEPEPVAPTEPVEEEE